MEIINYFDIYNKIFWKEKIGKSDWGAGQYLSKLLRNDYLMDLLVEEQTLISFCTLAEQDEVRDTSLTPWIGFVYTYL